MIVVKLTCQKCGTIFDFNPTDYSVKGLTNIPKKCPACCDMSYKLEKVVIKRECLRYFEGVKIEKIPSIIWHEGKNSVVDSLFYYIGEYGGRKFGEWGGASFDKKLIFYLENLKPEQLKNVLVDIREMKKVWKRNGHEPQENVYYSITVSNATKPNYYLYELRSWFKTTLKGFGRDRNYKEIVTPEAEADIISLCSVSTSARSGRFGNRYEIILARIPLQIEGVGIQ